MNARAIGICVVLGSAIVTFGLSKIFDSKVFWSFALLFCAILSISCAFEHKRVRSRWARVLFTAIAVIMMTQGAVDLFRHYALWKPSTKVEFQADDVLDFVGGIVVI